MEPVITYRERKYKYQLLDDVAIDIPVKGYNIHERFFTLTPQGRLVIGTGYAWDGASGTVTVDTEDTMFGSLVHDVGYQMMREMLLPIEYKVVFDKLLHDVCIANGMNGLRADIWYAAVEHFGGRSCEPGSEKHEIKTAPAMMSVDVK